MQVRRSSCEVKHQRTLESQRTISDWCDRTGPGGRERIRGILSLFHCPKEARQLQSHFRPEMVELLDDYKIQDGDPRVHPTGTEKGRLLSFTGPTGSLSTCAYQTSTPKILALLLSGSSSAISRSSIRIILSPSSLQKGPCHSGSTSLTPESCCLPVPCQPFGESLLLPAGGSTHGPDYSMPDSPQFCEQEKSQLVPSQTISYLGVNIDSVRFLVTLSQERQDKIYFLAQNVRTFSC